MAVVKVGSPRNFPLSPYFKVPGPHAITRRVNKRGDHTHRISRAQSQSRYSFTISIEATYDDAILHMYLLQADADETHHVVNELEKYQFNEVQETINRNDQVFTHRLSQVI